jgi:hypothetical protein
MEYDNLLAGLTPAPLVQSGTIRLLAEETAYARGTVLAKSNVDNKLVILGTAADAEEELTADCVLCEDTVVGTDADVFVAVYAMGNLNEDALTVADGYTMTEADSDELRKKGIYLKTMFE